MQPPVASGGTVEPTGRSGVGRAFRTAGWATFETVLRVQDDSTSGGTTMRSSTAQPGRGRTRHRQHGGRRSARRTGRLDRQGRPKPLYISMGDSYSVGYQNPTLGNTKGFTGYVAKKEKLPAGELRLRRCHHHVPLHPDRLPARRLGGHRRGPLSDDRPGRCRPGLPRPARQLRQGPAGHRVHQRQRRDRRAPTTPIPIPCVQAATGHHRDQREQPGRPSSTPRSTANGDTAAHIVGITYPDVILGTT